VRSTRREERPMKKSLIACVAVGLMLAGGLIALLGPRHCPVDRAAFERVEEGMTRAEVHAILGGPPGDYRTGPEAPAWGGVLSEGSDGRIVEFWVGDEGTVMVHFYVSGPRKGTVILAKFVDASVRKHGPVEQVRWRLRKLGAWLPRRPAGE
jgi:hypothetical protein